jgi:N-acetylglucosamine kinase-like BadF-type ATPase
MTRTSLYITDAAAQALDVATSQVVAALGDDKVPRHVALSALLLAGAGQADVVAQQLIKERAAELTKRLAALQQSQASPE